MTEFIIVSVALIVIALITDIKYTYTKRKRG